MHEELLSDPAFASSFDILTDIAEPLDRALPNDARWYVVGGLATAALRHPDTSIGTMGTIKTSYAADIPAKRPNGTLRDVDILVDAVVHPEAMQYAKQVAEQAADGRLEVSLFGFDDATKHQKDKYSFLSRRVMDQAGQRYHQLGPIRQPVPPESYEAWGLILPSGIAVPVLHPVGHLLAYRGRSVSGLRPKDTEKFYQMANKIFSQEAFREEVKTGAFASWNQFTNAIADIRQGRQPDTRLLREGTSLSEIAAMRWQGRLLKTLEAHPKIVDICQSNFMQRIFSSAVRAA